MSFKSSVRLAVAISLVIPGAAWAQTTLAVPSSGVISVEVTRGRVEISGWERAELSVDGNRSFEAVRSSSGAQVRRVRGREYEDRDILRLRIPSGSRVILNGSSVDADFRDIEGEVEVRLVSGDVSLARIGGRVIVTTLSGDVEAERLSSDVQVRTSSGDVILTDVRGTIDIRTTSGDIDIRSSRAQGVQLETMSGDVTFTGVLEADGRNGITTHSGDVILNFGNDARAQIDMSSFSGRIRSETPMLLLPRSLTNNRGNDATQRLQLGGAGGPTLRISTFNGDITIVRSGARDNN